jgi:hypothetical protein
MALRSVDTVSREDTRPFSLAVMVLAVLLACKFLYLSFFVTPLWDIPDEIGHVAYVMHLAEGKGIPVLGSAEIPSEIMSHLRQTQGAEPASNWIAQHPPLYYLLAAVPYRIAQFFTSDVEILYRVPRIVAALCGALLLLVLYRTARLLGLGDRAALCFAGCTVSIPMFSHMSSGTSHDVPLFLTGALAAHFLARFVQRHELRDAYYAAIWLSVASAIKMTAWVLLPPFLLVIAWELRGGWRSWALQLLGVAATACSLPAAWMLRNLLQYGDPTYTAIVDMKWQLAEPLRVSYVTFLATMPVIEHYVLNFYGIIGGIGTGTGSLKWFQVDGFPRMVFTMALLVISATLLWQFYTSVRQPAFGSSARLSNRVLSSRLRGLGLWPYAQVMIAGAVAAVFAAVISVSVKGGMDMNMRLAAVAMILALGAGACIAILFGGRSDRRLFMYGLAGFMFFCVVLSVKNYELYLLDGRLRAIHGRYLYPVLPWLLLSLGVALAARPWGERLLLVAFPLLVLAETDAYINQVLPFIGGGAR